MLNNNNNANENITFNLIDDIENDNYNYNDNDNDYYSANNTLTAEFYELMNKGEGGSSSDCQYDKVYIEIKNYDLNFTVKQLTQICEYYNLSKDIKLNKMKKQEIIEQIIMFENNDDNYDIVLKRKELWYYMNELKNDKQMKKFVIFL